MKRIMVTLVAAGVALVVAGSVSACGTTTGTAGPSPQPSSSTPATPATTTDAVATAAVDPGGLCGWLAAELPAVQAAAVNAATTARGTNIGAETQFAIDYGSWIAEDPAARKLDDATHLDTVTTAKCPSIRTQYAKALGADSFSGALGP